jgi:hypothetical protein
MPQIQHRLEKPSLARLFFQPHLFVADHATHINGSLR